MDLVEGTQAVQSAQRQLIQELWHEQRAHCARMHQEWDMVWEQAIQSVLPPVWSKSTRHARSVLETVYRLYAQALRGTETLPRQTLVARRDGIVALMHELQSVLGGSLPDQADETQMDPACPTTAYVAVLEEHPWLQGCIAHVLCDDEPVRLFGADGNELLFSPPCDVHATDQPPDLLFSADEFATHGVVREELLVAAFAHLVSNAPTPPRVTTVWHIGQDFGLGGPPNPAVATHPIVAMLLGVQRTLLRRIFLASPPAHATSLRQSLGAAQCLLLSHDNRSIHEILAFAPEPSPMLWVPIPTCYTAYTVDLIVEALHLSGCTPQALSLRTLPACSPAPPTQVWPMWLRLHVVPPTGADFVKGWPTELQQQLKESAGRCCSALRQRVLRNTTQQSMLTPNA